MSAPSYAPPLGAFADTAGVRFAVQSQTASRVWVSLFDRDGNHEAERLAMQPAGDGIHTLFVEGLAAGARYGLRADGDYVPDQGFWFDPDKLLVDPYAAAIDRPYVYDARLAAPRGAGVDTAPLMPKAVVTELPPALTAKPPLLTPGGLIYEANVRALTIRHPDIPEALRGTVAALVHPAIIEHLQSLGVSAIELMPIVAWIDERHLPPLG